MNRSFEACLCVLIASFTTWVLAVGWKLFYKDARDKRLDEIEAALLSRDAWSKLVPCVCCVSLGGDTEPKLCEYRCDTGIPEEGWWCAECYNDHKNQE